MNRHLMITELECCCESFTTWSAFIYMHRVMVFFHFTSSSDTNNIVAMKIRYFHVVLFYVVVNILIGGKMSSTITTYEAVFPIQESYPHLLCCPTIESRGLGWYSQDSINWLFIKFFLLLNFDQTLENYTYWPNIMKWNIWISQGQ